MVRAGEIATEADCFSFGTNDLTQMTLGFSRDDVEGKFLPFYLAEGVIESNPFEVLDINGVGDLMRIVRSGSKLDGYTIAIDHIVPLELGARTSSQTLGRGSQEAILASFALVCRRIAGWREGLQMWRSRPG